MTDKNIICEYCGQEFFEEIPPHSCTAGDYVPPIQIFVKSINCGVCGKEIGTCEHKRFAKAEPIEPRFWRIKKNNTMEMLDHDDPWYWPLKAESECGGFLFCKNSFVYKFFKRLFG